MSDNKEPPHPVNPSSVELAAPDPLLGWIDHRHQTSLNGTWRCIVDPMGVGEPGSFFGGFPQNRKVHTGMELVEYDFDRAQTLRVPGDWNSQDNRLFFYQGRVWYFRRFEHTPDPQQRTHLYFDGANFHARVFLNGQPLGEHIGGYVPFNFDITEVARDGTNELMICVDNRLDARSVPTERTDWWPYGGLTRDVMLVHTPQQFIRNAHVCLSRLAPNTIRFDLSTQGFTESQQGHIVLPELDIETHFEVSADGRATVELQADVTLWQPGDPKLYDVIIRLGEDQISDQIGFRTIDTQGQQILLNGEAIKLKGISTHEEPIGSNGVAYSADHMRHLLQEAKALGANFVRAAHYPYCRHMAREADRLGIMLWAEIPVYWNIDWEHAPTLDVASDMLGRLIQRDWQRASVIIWSVANETPNSPARMAFLQQLLAGVNRLDDSRLTSAALLGGGRHQFQDIMRLISARGLADPSLPAAALQQFQQYLDGSPQPAPGADEGYELVIDDPLSDHVDIVAYNQYFGWYYSIFFAQRLGVGEDIVRPIVLSLMKDIRISATVDKPVHISEFGAEAVAGQHDDQAHVWSEEYQNKVYEAQLAMLSASEQVQGISPWILKDFRAMLRPLAGVQDYYNRKGLIDEHGQRKLAFATLARFYQAWA